MINETILGNAARYLREYDPAYIDKSFQIPCYTGTLTLTLRPASYESKFSVDKFPKYSLACLYTLQNSLSICKD